VKFRKKPVVIEALRFDGTVESVGEIDKHFGDRSTTSGSWIVGWCMRGGGGSMLVQTLEGVMVASAGDWIIRGVKGELYPCKPDIFEASYEAVTP